MKSPVHRLLFVFLIVVYSYAAFMLARLLALPIALVIFGQYQVLGMGGFVYETIILVGMLGLFGIIGAVFSAWLFKRRFLGLVAFLIYTLVLILYAVFQTFLVIEVTGS